MKGYFQMWVQYLKSIEKLERLHLGKKISLICFLIGVFTACTQQSQNIPLDTDEKKISYAIGYKFGQSLKSQGIQVDTDVIAMSIQDTLSDDQKSRMTDDEMLKAIQNMQKSVIAKQRQQAQVNKKKGEDFLEKNKSAEGVLSTDSGLQYQVQKMGDGRKPNIDSVVSVHYSGTLITGEEFDSSYKRGRPAEFPVSGVIQGWTEALQLMPVGSKWKLFIPSQLAYGPQGRPQIPAYSTLIFEVELLDIIEPQQKNKGEKVNKSSNTKANPKKNNKLNPKTEESTP